jgi:hypothetical protein
LATDADCAGWLQGAGGTATDVIQTLLGGNYFGFGAFNQPQIAAVSGSVNADGSPTGIPVGILITVDTLGAFFNANNSSGQAWQVGVPKYVGGTLQAQATILIHELAHTIGAKGFQSDTGNAQAGADNDALVNQNCGKLIAGLK